MAHSASGGSRLLLLLLRLLRQSLITYLRDTVQNPYLLHPHRGYNKPERESVSVWGQFRVLGRDVNLYISRSRLYAGNVSGVLLDRLPLLPYI